MKRTSLGDRFTIKQGFDKAKKYQWNEQVGAKTTIQRALEAVSFFSPGMPIVDITAKEVIKYRKFLAKELNNSPATINAKVSTIKVMREMAVIHGEVKILPEMPKNLPVDNHKDIIWEDLELGAVCDDLMQRNREEIARFLVFLCEMGCRPVEMRRQTASDYDFDEKTVTFFKRAHDNKTSNRTLPLTPVAFDIAKRQVKNIHHLWTETQVWTTPERELNYQVTKSLNRCGIEKSFVIKATRHTCGTKLGRRGCTSLEIAAWLGHSSEQMCQRYVHMPHDQHAKAFNALTRLRAA